MKKFRTIVSLIAMVLAGVVGFFVGSTLENAFGGAILFSLIVGIACVVYFWISQSKRKGRADYLRNINIIPKKDGTL